MAHSHSSDKKKKKLINRVNRVMGQVAALQRALEHDEDCSHLLHTISACRGAMDSLMALVIEEHIRLSILPPDGKATKDQTNAAEDLVSALRAYLK